MKNSINIAMLGGDRRQIAAVRRLSEHYSNIKVFGIDEKYLEKTEGIIICDDIAHALADAEVAVLPLPASVDGTTLNSPLCADQEGKRLNCVLKLLPPDAVIVGGRMPQGFVVAAETAGYRVIDYFTYEDLQIKNAYTTAEAALSIAMNSLDKNLRGARVAVTGYGRIAKHLCSLLLSIGADVTIAARRDSDLSWAQSCGCDTLKIGADKSWLTSLESGYDVIYNTVPTWLFDRDFLSRAAKSTFIVDLASAPGGVDIRAAKELGANVSWATSLPGKYAPRSAGELIADCVGKIVREVAE